MILYLFILFTFRAFKTNDSNSNNVAPKKYVIPQVVINEATEEEDPQLLDCIPKSNLDKVFSKTFVNDKKLNITKKGK